jgi:type IV secretion system protein VirB11
LQAQLVGALKQRENILVSRATGSAKTTLVKALLDLIPEEERILLIEDRAELPLVRPNRVALYGPGRSLDSRSAESLAAAQARSHHRW